jgi:hypothetical protein
LLVELAEEARGMRFDADDDRVGVHDHDQDADRDHGADHDDSADHDRGTHTDHGADNDEHATDRERAFSQLHDDARAWAGGRRSAQ